METVEKKNRRNSNRTELTWCTKSKDVKAYLGLKRLYFLFETMRFFLSSASFY